LQLDPRHVEACLIVALSHAPLGQPAKAVEALSRLPGEERDRPLVREMQAGWHTGLPDNYALLRFLNQRPDSCDEWDVVV